MRFRPRRAREEPDINLIPLIDVLLVILIFLAITTTYSRYTELKINLPTADAEKAAERPAQIMVSVTENGAYSVDRQALDTRDATSLADALRSAAGNAGKRESMVIVNADAQAAHQAVINVMEAARMAGLSRLTFATQTGKADR